MNKKKFKISNNFDAKNSKKFWEKNILSDIIENETNDEDEYEEVDYDDYDDYDEDDFYNQNKTDEKKALEQSGNVVILSIMEMLVVWDIEKIMKQIFLLLMKMFQGSNVL